MMFLLVAGYCFINAGDHGIVKGMSLV
jgi:hypothetical protein